MKVFPASQDRRSFCKVAIDDVSAYRELIIAGLARRRPGQTIGPLLCLGTRSGREVDL